MRKKFFILFLSAIFSLVLFHGNVYCLTLSDLETEIRVTIDDNGEVGRQAYPDSVLDDYLNEAQRDVVSQTWCMQKSYDISLSSGTTFYALPTDTISILHVRYKNASNQTSVLEQLPLKKLYETNPSWSNTGGSIQNYTIDQGSTTDQLQMGFYKPPTTSSTGTVTVFYTYQAQDMSNDTDVPFDGFYHLYPYHMTLVYHVVARIALKEGDAAGAQSYLSFYSAGISTMRENLGRMPDYNPTGHAYTPTMPK